MSKAEILVELSKLSRDERLEIWEQFCRLDEAAGPSEQERAALNEAQAAYDANPGAGAPWSEVEARLRRGA
jgi:putative addiction module component (TIGR02574 family)